MKITGKAKTAIKILIILANSEDRLSVREIAATGDLPVRYSEQIVSILKKNDLVNSTKGANGGYTLSHPAESVKIWDLVVKTEGENPFAETLKGHLDETMNEMVFESLDQMIQDKLSQISLADLVATYKKKSNQEYMYYI